MTFFTASSVLAQKKVTVRQTYLPNSSYASVMDMKSTTTIFYYDEKQTPPKLVEIDTTVASSYISSMTRTGSENSDGEIPFAIAYNKLLISDSDSDSKTSLPKDAVLHGKWLKTHMQLDSISSDSLTSLGEFKMRQLLQGIYSQMKQHEIEVKQGEKTYVNKTLEFPSSKGPIACQYQFVYEIVKMEGNLATISLVIVGDVPELPDASMKAMTISGTGSIVYDTKIQTMVNSTFNMRVISKNSRNEVGMTLQLDTEMNMSNNLLN